MQRFHSFFMADYEDLQDLLELTPQKDVLFIIVDWNAKVGSQDTRGLTNKRCLGVQNEAGERLTEFCKEKALVVARDDFILGLHQMVNTKIRLIIFFGAKDGEALYGQKKKKDWELAVAQIINSLLPNSDLS